MNDAERDAWLREALRHAPDSDALPPRGVSEAILLKARAAARATAPPTRRAGWGDVHANPLTALWNWLARPPVAAGFASVLAATLVGVMWWDRPMDDALPRPPALASDRAPAATPPVASTSPAPAAADAKLAEPAATPAQRSVDLLAKEGPTPSEKKSEAPAPFPSTERQRETSSPLKSLDAAAANDARKKDAEASRSRAADEVERAAEPAPQAPLASGRLAADERRQAAPAESTVAAKAKSAAAAPPVAATPAAAPPESAFGGMREQGGAGLASSAPVPSAAPAPFRSESQGRSESLSRADASPRTVAPARVFAAIAAEPERWLRQSAGGDTVALDAAWRAWLAELDAAAAGRWQPLGAAAPPSDGAAARDGSTTLRLVHAGRVAAIVRLDGMTAQLDAAPGSGTDRWQAILAPAGAEQLRSTARRLSP